MNSTRRLWTALAVLLLVSFGVLLWSGQQIYEAAPPVPERVVTSDGELVYTRADIQLGRQVWQSMGGMQLGSIWGHGGYIAPDWSADWLHRELVALLNIWAEEEFGVPYEELTAERKAALQGRLRGTMRANTYDPDTETIVIGTERARAIAAVSEH